MYMTDTKGCGFLIAAAIFFGAIGVVAFIAGAWWLLSNISIVWGGQ